MTPRNQRGAVMLSNQELTKGGKMLSHGEERVLKCLSAVVKDVIDILPDALEENRARLFGHMVSRITGGRISSCDAQILWRPAAA